MATLPQPSDPHDGDMWNDGAGGLYVYRSGHGWVSTVLSPSTTTTTTYTPYSPTTTTYSHRPSPKHLATDTDEELDEFTPGTPKHISAQLDRVCDIIADMAEAIEDLTIAVDDLSTRLNEVLGIDKRQPDDEESK